MSRKAPLPSLLSRIEALRFVTEQIIFYNLDNSRDDAQVARELRAFATARPAIIGICEAIGNTLPELHGYRLVRDRSTRSRQNIAAYVRKDLPVTHIEWIDLKKTWPRTNGKGGTHEARSYLKMRIGYMSVIVAHQPQRPLGSDELRRRLVAARTEGIERLSSEMTPAKTSPIALARPRLLMSDFNGRIGEQQGPHIVAKKIKGVVTGGERIDNVISRGAVKVHRYKTFSRIDGVELKSDHKHAVSFEITLRSAWLYGFSKSK